MPRNVNNTQALATWKVKPGKAQFYSNSAELFLLKAIGVYAGQGLDQAGLAMVDVACRAQNNLFQRSTLPHHSLLRLRKFSKM